MHIKAKNEYNELKQVAAIWFIFCDFPGLVCTPHLTSTYSAFFPRTLPEVKADSRNHFSKPVSSVTTALTGQNTLRLTSIHCDDQLTTIFVLTIANPVPSNDAVCRFFTQPIPPHDYTLDTSHGPDDFTLKHQFKMHKGVSSSPCLSFSVKG